MKYIITPGYTFQECETYRSDKLKIERCWALYGRYDKGNNFALAAGIYGPSWVSGGANERRNHSKRYPYRKALHAEQVAIMSSRYNVEGTAIYICRRSEDSDTFQMAQPCFWCMHQIIKAGISKVIYTQNFESIVAFKVSTVKIKPVSSLGIDYHMFQKNHDFRLPNLRNV